MRRTSESKTLNQRVAGSNPAAPTREIKGLTHIRNGLNFSGYTSGILLMDIKKFESFPYKKAQFICTGP
mgnify:CR=1 FL=1